MSRLMFRAILILCIAFAGTTAAVEAQRPGIKFSSPPADTPQPRRKFERVGEAPDLRVLRELNAKTDVTVARNAAE